jgi:hypothetical protein
MYDFISWVIILYNNQRRFWMSSKNFGFVSQGQHLELVVIILLLPNKIIAIGNWFKSKVFVGTGQMLRYLVL